MFFVLFSSVYLPVLMAETNTREALQTAVTERTTACNPRIIRTCFHTNMGPTTF